MEDKNDKLGALVWSVLRFLSRADFVFYSIPLLMILLVIGTLSQAELGLYLSQKLFFSSFIAWLGPLPFPGGYTLIGVITLNLTCKFIFFSDWRWPKAGIILSHLGALVLLFGAMVTAFTAEENYMIIPEGGETPFIYDYIEREFSVYDEERSVFQIPFGELQQGQTIFIPATDIVLKVEEKCKNCSILKRTDAGNIDDLPLLGMAQHMALMDKEPNKDPEADLSGVTFTVTGGGDTYDGRYIAFDAMPTPIMLEADDKKISIIFGKAQKRLPFSLFLKDFTKESYQGIDKARSYASDLILKDGNLSWPVRIEMNKPLRYRGYTFYQSSFEQQPDGKETTILSVVKNQGRLFPYLGSLIIGAGLFVHLILRIRKKKI